MKFCLTIVLLVATSAFSLPIDRCKNEWNQFKVTYDKLYDTEQEENHRFEIFCNNLDIINDHNEKYEKRESTYKLGVNQYTDLTEEEMEQHMGLHISTRLLKANDCRTEWTEFKKTYEKLYDSEEEEIRRFKIFCNHLNEIIEHNEDYQKGKTTYQMELNKFADLTDEEMNEFMGLLPKPRMLNADHCTEEWSSFKETYNKLYNSVDEETYRFKIFCNNLERIERHNEEFKEGKTTYEMGVNQFADLTDDEMEKYHGLIPNSLIGDTNDCSIEWITFKKMFTKIYVNEAEEERRFEIFCTNLQTIQEHNRQYEKGQTSYKMGVNKFSDLTDQEMKKHMGIISNHLKSATSNCKSEWVQFKITYEKLYDTEEENYRFNIFCSRLEEIVKHNKEYEQGLTTYKTGVNKFSDMTDEEMKEYMGIIPSSLQISDHYTTEWALFKEKYDKLYASREEEEKRFKIFCINLDIIENHNKQFDEGKMSYRLDVNQFTDLTQEEMQQYHHGLIVDVSETDVCAERWESYKKQFGKIYNINEEDSRRFNIFCDSLHKIIKHNEDFEKGLTTFRMGLNKFADMTKEEIEKYLGFSPTRLPRSVTREDMYKAEWEKFKKTYKRLYLTEEEERHRFGIFSDNLDKINKHNQLYKEKKTTYMMGVNRFSDMTHEEYLEWLKEQGGGL